MEVGEFAYKGIILSIRILACEYHLQYKIYPKGSDFGVEMYYDFLHFYKMFDSKSFSIHFENETIEAIKSFYLFITNVVESSEDNFFDFDIIENDPQWEAIRTAAKNVVPYFDDSVSRLDNEDVIRFYIGSFNN
jgi:hypothetical protein